MAAPQFKAVLIATPQMRSESGLTLRSKQSAVWPADPRGRRGGCGPAGKTCYLPRFHIMYRPAVLPVEDRRSCGEDARKQTDPCADFVCLELSRGRTLGWNQYVELEIKKAKVNGTASKLPAAQKPCDKMAEAIVMDGGKRGQTVEVRRSRLPRPSFRHAHFAAGRRVAQDFRMPTPRSVWVPRPCVFLQGREQRTLGTVFRG